MYKIVDNVKTKNRKSLADLSTYSFCIVVSDSKGFKAGQLLFRGYSELSNLTTQLSYQFRESKAWMEEILVEEVDVELVIR